MNFREISKRSPIKTNQRPLYSKNKPLKNQYLADRKIERVSITNTKTVNIQDLETIGTNNNTKVYYLHSNSKIPQSPKYYNFNKSPVMIQQTKKNSRNINEFDSYKK